MIQDKPTSNNSKKPRKQLYDYQEEGLKQIFDYLESNVKRSFRLLYQLPTGGGKTVIFSEIARRFIEKTGKKVIILTHRTELSVQTATMLTEFGMDTKIINSQVKELENQDQHNAYVAMVETLNNRLSDQDFEFENIGLVIIDEAHYNSFRKLFKFFNHQVMIGVTATPLSSNIKLPMYENYEHLIVGHSITQLITGGFLAKPKVHRYDVGLGSLKIGANGDYTVSSSERLYSTENMQGKLIRSYRERALGTKTLIFNNGIKTSRQVYHNFKSAGFEIRHLDNKNSPKERKEILHWFKTKPDAILTSVGILTTGFDEPTVETIILNRATKSLTLYFQMIGRGSRILADKKHFTILDLGNNVARFGPWDGEIDWNRIFRSPDFYLQNLISDEELESRFTYIMPDEMRLLFSKSKIVTFDMGAAYDKVLTSGLPSYKALDDSIKQHTDICIENSSELLEARQLAYMLEEDIAQRIQTYSYFIAKSTLNYKLWLREDYMKKLLKAVSNAY